MIYLTLIDDDVIALNHLNKEISGYFNGRNIEVSIHSYSSGDEFLKERPQTDILFLDVEMPGKNGIEVAKEVRLTDKNVIIFFCTNFRQFAINGYEVNALGFMVKPIERYSLSLNLDHALNFLKEEKRLEQKNIVLHAYQSIIVLPHNDVIYIEVKKHNLFYHLTQESEYPLKELKIRGTMNTLCDNLKNDNFVKSGNSFLVNLEHVITVKGDKVLLKNRTSLPLSRIYKESFMAAFTKYLVKKGSIIL